MKKGFKVLFCKRCQRKRHCRIIKTVSYWTFWSCSKGHEWRTDGRYTKIVDEELERIIPQSRNLFDRDASFFRELSKRNNR